MAAPGNGASPRGEGHRRGSQHGGVRGRRPRLGARGTLRLQRSPVTQNSAIGACGHVLPCVKTHRPGGGTWPGSCPQSWLLACTGRPHTRAAATRAASHAHRGRRRPCTHEPGTTGADCRAQPCSVLTGAVLTSRTRDWQPCQRLRVRACARRNLAHAKTARNIRHRPWLAPGAHGDFAQELGLARRQVLADFLGRHRECRRGLDRLALARLALGGLADTLGGHGWRSLRAAEWPGAREAACVGRAASLLALSSLALPSHGGAPCSSTREAPDVRFHLPGMPGLGQVFQGSQGCPRHAGLGSSGAAAALLLVVAPRLPAPTPRPLLVAVTLPCAGRGPLPQEMPPVPRFDVRGLWDEL